MLTAAVEALPDGESPFVYLACGTADPILPAGRALVKILQQHEIPHEYREVPGAHTWEVWDPQTLAFLDVVTARPGFRSR